ncbi:kinase-like protein [Trametes elegans]|nr:kinase-like protein [Trametes elegans]
MKVVHYSRGMSEVSCQGTINELLVLRKLAEESRRAPFLLQPYVEGSFWAWRSAGEYLHILTDVCTGGELSYYRNQIPEHRLALVCAEVILGMNYLHRLGIVHHDIKPQNVLVNGDGHCVLSDYGGAQFLDGHSHIRRPRRMQAVMTKPFAAPELLGVDDAATAACTKAVDYWALGATIVWLTMEDRFLPGTSDPHTLTMRLGRIRDEMEKADASAELQHFVMAVSATMHQRCIQYLTDLRLCHVSYCDLTQTNDQAFKDYVKPVGVLAHGFMLGTARVHNAREPVNLLERMRQAQLSLVADESFDVEAHNAAMAVALDG